MNGWVLPAAAAVACASACLDARAHGFAGQRFFPATIATDDPFVADELSLPTLARRNAGSVEGGASTTESSASVDYAKSITTNFGVSVGANYLREASGGEVRNGFDNVALGAKYVFYRNEDHEAIASLGLDWDIGGTGSRRAGAESHSTYTAAILFGKGFGDLPESVPWLRPLAVTGSLGMAIPSRTGNRSVDDAGNLDVERNPDVARLGLAIEYSIPYLQSFVQDVGFAKPFSRMVPLVEVDLRKPVDRGSRPWTGTVNPGVIWSGRYVQAGVEAVIPVAGTGRKTGVLLQLHFYLDDLLPRRFGKPVR